MNYVCVEGVDGVGKTTIMRALADQMIVDGIKFILTKEPGGPEALAFEWNTDAFNYPFGNMYRGFRDMCVDHPEIPQLVKRALYKADSFYNWLTVSKPVLKAGNTVLSDRSWLSDLAYGKAVAGLELEQLMAFNTSLIPEQQAATRVIYLTCDPVIRAKRLAANMTDAADSLVSAVQLELVSAYAEAIGRYVKEFVVIDSSMPVEYCVEQAKAFVYAGIKK